MDINKILQKQNLTRYKLSKITGVPQATIADICSGKADIDKCTIRTINKIAMGLGVTMEELMENQNEEKDLRLNRILHSDFTYDEFRSEICHMYEKLNDADFLEKILKNKVIDSFWMRHQYIKALYTLAMIDYICWKNNVPPYNGYNKIRDCKLKETVYPAEVVMVDMIEGGSKNREKAFEECQNNPCGLFFIKHNIVERSITNG